MISLVKKYKSFRKSEFENYFKDISTIRDGNTYSGQGWSVIIQDEVVEKTGPMTFITVTLLVELDESIQCEFLEKLRIQFLRGGG